MQMTAVGGIRCDLWTPCMRVREASVEKDFVAAVVPCLTRRHKGLWLCEENIKILILLANLLII